MTTRAAIVLLSLSTIATAQMSSADRAIREIRERSNRALNDRDVKAMADGLASDFVQVRGSGAFTPTKEAYLESLALSFADPKSVTYKRTPDKIEVSSAAPLAAE